MLVIQMPEIVNILLKCFGICVAAMSELKKKKRMRHEGGKNLKQSRQREVLLAAPQQGW